MFSWRSFTHPAARGPVAGPNTAIKMKFRLDELNRLLAALDARILTEDHPPAPGVETEVVRQVRETVVASLRAKRAEVVTEITGLVDEISGDGVTTVSYGGVAGEFFAEAAHARGLAERFRTDGNLAVGAFEPTAADSAFIVDSDWREPEETDLVQVGLRMTRAGLEEVNIIDGGLVVMAIQIRPGTIVANRGTGMVLVFTPSPVGAQWRTVGMVPVADVVVPAPVDEADSSTTAAAAAAAAESSDQ